MCLRFVRTGLKPVFVSCLAIPFLPQLLLGVGDMNMDPVPLSGSVHLSLKQLNTPNCSEIQCFLFIINMLLCLFLALGTSSSHIGGESSATEPLKQGPSPEKSLWCGKGQSSRCEKLGALR